MDDAEAKPACTNCSSPEFYARRTVITTLECEACGYRENVGSEPVVEEDGE